MQFNWITITQYNWVFIAQLHKLSVEWQDVSAIRNFICVLIIVYKYFH